MSALFEQVRELTLASPDEILALDVDGTYDAARPLLLATSAAARRVASAPGYSRGRPGQGSDLVAADLSGCDLTWTDLLGADLRDADLSGARLGRTIYLTQMQVSAARGDATTVLPDGFQRPGHWAVG